MNGVSVKRSAGKIPLGRQKLPWNDNAKTDLKEI
jgi:hypothetical protein